MQCGPSSQILRKLRHPSGARSVVGDRERKPADTFDDCVRALEHDAELEKLVDAAREMLKNGQ